MTSIRLLGQIAEAAGILVVLGILRLLHPLLPPLRVVAWAHALAGRLERLRA